LISFALATLSGLAPATLRAERVTLPTRTAALAATDQGALPGSAPITLTVRLAPSADRVAALKQRLADQMNPVSAEYHQWLTPRQFAASFGATDDQIVAATGWLTAQGLSVTAVSAARTTLTVTGPAERVQTAFAVSLHQMLLGGTAFYANVTQPSLPDEATSLIAGVSGLDDLPATLSLAGSTATDVPGALAAALDANTTPILTLSSTTCDADVAQADLDTYTALFQQANAQGVTVLAASACATGLGAFPASLGEVTAIALPGATAAAHPLPLETRPSWQAAPGLPADQFRHEPDLTATSVAAFAQAISTISLSTGGRLGNINQTLYDLGPLPGLYTQTDGAAAGTWESGSGLGLIDLDTLVKAYPRGTGSSFTGLAASSYAPVYGTSVTFTGTVTSGTGGAIPTGTVSFTTSTGTTLGSGALNASGVATYATSTLPAGTTTVTANYSGDSTYATSKSPSAAIFVTPSPLVLTATVSTGNTVGGTYTVTVNTSTSGTGAVAPIGTPTGTVTVTLSGTTTSYTGAWQASSQSTASATITIPATVVGTSSLLISCAGDANFSCPNPITTTVTVGKATPALTLSYTPKPAVSGAAISFTASLAAVGTAAVPSGNVRFFDNGTLINAGTLASGTVQVTGTDITAATHTISATYDGDANYLTVSAISTGTAVTSTAVTPSATKNIGQAFTFTATITPATLINSTLPTGSVIFYDGTTSLGTGTITGNAASINVASLSTTAVHSITAVYSGDGVYAPSTSSAVTIAAATLTTTTTALEPSATKNFGQAFTFAAAVTPSTVVNGVSPTGNIQFLDGTTVLGTVALASGSASLAVPSLATNVAHSITAVYTGDTNYASSTSPPVNLVATIGTTPSTTTVTANPTTVTTSGTPVTYTVAVAGTVTNNTTATGTVALTSGGVSLGTVSLVGGTGSVVSTAALANGANVVTATYSGDTTFASSTATTTVTVGTTAVVGTLTATVAPTTGAYNTSAVVTATVAVATGSTIPTGATVSASYSGLTGTYTGVVTAGIATITLPIPPPATYNIVVGCVSTTAFSCSNTVNIPFVATKSASTTSLSINPVSVLGGQTFTLTATVAPSPGTTALTTALPTGTVTFYNNGAAIGSANVNSSGVAIRTTSLAAGGTGVYTATYNGDTNYLTSTTASSTSITATKITPTIVFFSNGSPTLQGLNVIFTIQVTNYTAQAGTVPTPSGTVTLYDTSTGIPLFIGTATLGSNGVATGIATFSTTGLFAGTHTIYAVYGGDGNYLPITSTTITVDVSDFKLAFSPGTLQVARGGSATTTVIATPIDQFNGTITMACAPPADILTTCTITPSTLSGGGQATLTITTTAATQAIPGGPHAGNRPGAWAWRLGNGTMLGMLLFLGIPRGRRRKPRAIAIVALALFAAGITANIGCGSSVSTATSTVTSGGTPLGTAVFTVTAQGAESIGTNRHSYPLQVTVTQ
jgi:hypothetical protein